MPQKISVQTVQGSHLGSLSVFFLTYLWPQNSLDSTIFKLSHHSFRNHHQSVNKWSITAAGFCLFSPSDSCQLTIDTNTVSRKLTLSEDNRKVTRFEELQPHPDHPDRFDFPQLLCRNRLTGRSYWEVEWTGDVRIAMSYRGIRKKGSRGARWCSW